MGNDESANSELANLGARMEILKQENAEKTWRNTRRLRWMIWITFIFLFAVYALSYINYPWHAEITHSFQFTLNLVFLGMIVMFICIESVLAGLLKAVELLRDEMTRVSREIDGLQERIQSQK